MLCAWHLPLDTDNEDQLGLSWDVERTILLGETSKTDLLALSLAVLNNVLLSTLEDDTTLLLGGLFNACQPLYKMKIKSIHDMGLTCQTRKMVNWRQH